KPEDHAGTDELDHEPGECQRGPCRTCAAGIDTHDVFIGARDLLAVGVLVALLHLATHELAGGWTHWALIALGVLIAFAADITTRAADPLIRVLVRRHRARKDKH